MNIRLAKETDFETIMNIYENARNFMKQNGNPNQWKDDYPPKNLIIKDIKEHKFLRVVENNESEICGVFYFKIVFNNFILTMLFLLILCYIQFIFQV